MNTKNGKNTPQIREVDEETIKNLTEGFTAIYQPTLKAMKTQLVEITKKQEFLCDELHKENMRLSAAIHSDELQKIFLKVKIYRDKLSMIKRDMLIIHELSTKLKTFNKHLLKMPTAVTAGETFGNSTKCTTQNIIKKRALKLEQQKQKEALEKVQKREYEELLISKPSTSTSSS